MSEKTVVLTYEGLKNLEDELQKLKTVRRKEIAEKIKEARGQGDLSENAEYDSAKEEQAEIEARIATIEKMLRNASVIDEDQMQKGVVNVGNTVKIHDNQFDEDDVYTIVGSAEANPFTNKISNESPLGVALLGHSVGEEVKAFTPDGEMTCKILEIK